MKSRSVLRLSIAVIMIASMLVAPLVAFAEGPNPPDEVQARQPVISKQFPPKDQPDPELYRQRRLVEKAILQGNQTEANSLAITGVGKILVLLVEFAGTDVVTWEPGNTWDPYGVAEEVEFSDFGDCTNVISQTTTFTFTPTLHNEVPVPPTAEYAYKGQTPDFGFTMWSPDFNQDYYQDLVFGDGLSYSYNAGNGDPVNIDVNQSLRTYYEGLSQGDFTVEGDVIGWIPLPHSMAWYGADLCPGALSQNIQNAGGADGYYNNPNGTVRVDFGTPRTAIMDAVDWINANMPGFDWGDYDQNADGRVDTILVVTADVDEANANADEHAIWPRSSSVDYCADPGPDGVCDTDDDIRTGAYIVQGETGGVAVFIHEYGHRLGADDLYTGGIGENSTGIWSHMSDSRGHGVPWDSSAVGMDPWHKLGWGWSNILVVDYDDPAAEIVLTQGSNPAPGEYDTVLIRLPDQIEQIETAHSPTHMWWGGRADLTNNLVYRPVDLGGATSATLTFWNKYDIEEAWDFGFVQVSADNGATWTSLQNDHTTFDHDPGAIQYVVDNLPGLTGHIDDWRQETFDLSAYAGQQIWLAFRYATDWATLGQGWWVDDIEVTADGNVVFSDDVESGQGPWMLDPADGWSISDGVFTYPHYYLVEWRNNDGVDANLATGRCDVENFGMLVWYVNDHKYTANEIYNNLDGNPSFGPKGKALVVDSHDDPLRDASSVFAHNARSNISARCYGMRDAAFGLDALNSFFVTQPPSNPSRWGNPNFEYPAQAAVSAFHDSMGYYPGLEYTDIRAIGDPRGPRYYWTTRERDASVVVPAAAPYGVGPADYPTGTGFLQWMPEYASWYGFWDWEAGTGNPGDTHVQYGIHLQVLDEAADGSWGRIKFWNSMYEFEGSVEQTGSTTPVVEGTYVDVDVTATNIGGAVADGLLLAPVDPDTMYVPGSAYGGAMPLTAEYAAQLAAAKGLADLAARAAAAQPDDVVAVAWSGPVATGETVDFGFQVKVMVSTGEVQHDVAVFDGATFINAIAGSPVTIVDNSTYPVNRSRRFNVDRDTFIEGNRPGAFNGDAQTMWLGFYDQMRPVVHTRLDGIPTDAAVDTAYLYLYVYEGRGFANWATSVIPNVQASPVSTVWMPDATNWWTPWTTPGGDFGPAGPSNTLGSGKIGTWLRLDVTAAAEDMLRSGFNQGFILTSDDTNGVRYGLVTKENWTGYVGYMRVYFRTAN